jgi:mediator of RNA polymerase II transcription subunit 6
MANPAPRPEDEDQTGVCWRDDQWLQFFPLTRQSALDYFSLSPFYDRSCNNEQAKLQGMDASKLACAPPRAASIAAA